MWDHIFCICLYLPINTTARNIDWRLHFHGHIKGLKPVQMPGYKCTPSTPGQIYASCVQHYTAVLSWLWAWSNWQLTSILCQKIGLKVKAMLAPSVMMANVGRRLMSTHSRLVVSVFGSKKSLHWKADIGSQKIGDDFLNPKTRWGPLLLIRSPPSPPLLSSRWRFLTGRSCRRMLLWWFSSLFTSKPSHHYNYCPVQGVIGIIFKIICDFHHFIIRFEFPIVQFTG